LSVQEDIGSPWHEEITDSSPSEPCNSSFHRMLSENQTPFRAGYSAHRAGRRWRRQCWSIEAQRYVSVWEQCGHYCCAQRLRMSYTALRHEALQSQKSMNDFHSIMVIGNGRIGELIKHISYFRTVFRRDRCVLAMELYE